MPINTFGHIKDIGPPPAVGKPAPSLAGCFWPAGINSLQLLAGTLPHCHRYNTAINGSREGVNKGLPSKGHFSDCIDS